MRFRPEAPILLPRARNRLPGGARSWHVQDKMSSKMWSGRSFCPVRWTENFWGRLVGEESLPFCSLLCSALLVVHYYFWDLIFKSENFAVCSKKRNISASIRHKCSESVNSMLSKVCTFICFILRKTKHVWAGCQSKIHVRNKGKYCQKYCWHFIQFALLTPANHTVFLTLGCMLTHKCSCEQIFLNKSESKEDFTKYG